MSERKAIKGSTKASFEWGACVHMAAVQERSLGCARDDEAGERMGSQGWRAVFLENDIPVSSAFPSRGRCPEGADRAQAA